MGIKTIRAIVTTRLARIRMGILEIVNPYKVQKACMNLEFLLVQDIAFILEKIFKNLMNIGKIISYQNGGKMKRSKSYREALLERLKVSSEAVAYLNAALQDEDTRVFLVALRDIVDANGGISMLAKETELNRETLYRTLSMKGNPTIENLILILDTLGFELQVKEAI